MTERIEFERPGHFIGANECGFFRHTHINQFCISTVGDYWPQGKQESLGVLWSGELGEKRFYETMVFVPPYDSGKYIDFAEYITEEEAYRGHEEMNKKYEDYLQTGIIEQYDPFGNALRTIVSKLVFP